MKMAILMVQKQCLQPEFDYQSLKTIAHVIIWCDRNHNSNAQLLRFQSMINCYVRDESQIIDSIKMLKIETKNFDFKGFASLFYQ